ncbi:hypothetical protein MYSTI_04278 [Myxococcus stipitatus DSM 14675]|uniref:Uncharacterized protein n=1 Tax=Myxococcus stipitatus (strain DSM 14675 / JCM 12634 / Mx s8) TaxID=1278073 RepID=L7U9G8_MYXSD|nr:hypothetical protein [Myxococcus stipitatus]AGC45576.1 hypothetical protein MYSTI_04278 [Myxococcus stipitatus DSM 14675]
MDAMELEALLRRANASDELLAWSRGLTLAEAWHGSPSGAWLIRLATAVGLERRLLLRALCACVRLATEHALTKAPGYEPVEDCVPLALEATEAWVRDTPGRGHDEVSALAAQASHSAYVADCLEGYCHVPFVPGAVHAAIAVAQLSMAACEERDAEFAVLTARALDDALRAESARHDYSRERQRDFDATCARVIRESLRAEDMACLSRDIP